MPESEDRKELDGLARSIDSLFSDGPAPEEASSDAEASAVEDATPIADQIAAAEAELAQVEAEIASVEAGIVRDDGMADLLEAHDVDGEPEVDVEDGVELESEEPEDMGAVEPEAELVNEGATELPEGAMDVGAVDSERESSEAAEPPIQAAPAPGPLASAVALFLTGGGDPADVRALATQHLDGRDYDPVAEAVETLIYASVERNEVSAMELATELLTPIVRSRIVQRLGHERSDARREAYHDICRALGEDMAVAIRDEMAEADDRFARRSYFDALVAMGDASRPVIEAMAEDENRFLARNAIAILGEVGGPRAVELVFGALANTDPRVRREALLAMAKLKVEDADEIIVGRILDDTEQSVRLAAAVTAGELGVQRAVRPLIAALDDAYETDDVLPLLHALGQIGDPGAVPSIEKHAVRELFAKPRTEVRIAAYQALNHIGTPHARRLLNQAVSDKDAEVKTAVKGLLHMR